MLSEGQLFYRFKFHLSGDCPEVVKHTFKVTKIEPWGSKTLRVYTTCLEDPNAKYSEGKVYSDNIDFYSVKTYGGYRSVILPEDSLDTAYRLVQESVQSAVEVQRAKLMRLENELEQLSNL